MKNYIKRLLHENLMYETLKHNNQFLYHTTNIKNYDDIKKYGLLPQFGDVVKQTYGDLYNLNGDTYDEDDYNKPQDLEFDGLLFFAEHPMLGFSQTGGKKFTLSEALVCVVKKNPTIYHKLEGDNFTDYRGQPINSVDYIATDNLPIIIEQNDWFSFKEQTPVMLLEGRYILEFMEKNFPSEYDRYI